MSRTKDELAVMVGQRIDEARQLARIRTTAELAQRSGLHEKAVRRYLGGEHLPQVPALIALARACHVSIDWLVLGDEPESGQALLDWLETPAGQAADPEAVAFLRRMPLHGYQPSVRFFDLAHQAWKHGLDPLEAAKAARETDLLSPRQ